MAAKKVKQVDSDKSNMETNTVNKNKPSKNYSLLKEIKNSKYYKKANNRNELVREELEEQCSPSRKTQLFPGQLAMFNYFNPKTKEELEYYDAMPVTIFFGKVNTSQGMRVVGFNIHFYPPTMRYRIMHRIFEIYKPVYIKYWDNIDHELDAFDYKYLLDNLEKAKLTFGVRMYIPTLIGDVRVIPPKLWYIAVFTEGAFKKQSRTNIMKYWQEYKGK